MNLLQTLDRALARLVALAAWLGLGVATLLFLQWPLRIFLGDAGRQANDVGQWLFALFLAASLVAATRANAHLAADAFARRFSPRARRMIWRVALLGAILPWSLFLLYAGAPIAWRSLLQLERYQDTLNPGYFLIKLAAFALPVLAALDALLELSRPDDTSPADMPPQ